MTTNYLRSLDRHIEYQTVFNIPAKDIETFIYFANAQRLYRMVLEDALDNVSVTSQETLYQRMLVLATHSPITLQDAKFSKLNSTEGFKVDFGHLVFKIAKDDKRQLSELLKWWEGVRIKDKLTINDKLIRFGSAHKYTTHLDWENIERENWDVMLHANPLLYLFSRRAWFTYREDVSPAEDVKRLTKVAKDLLKLISEHESSNAKFDSNMYTIALKYEGIYCEVSAKPSASLEGEHYYMLSFIDGRTHEVIDTLGLRSRINQYIDSERDIARIITFVMSNINPTAWDDYHMDKHYDNWFVDKEPEPKTPNVITADKPRDRDRVIPPEHGRYRYTVDKGDDIKPVNPHPVKHEWIDRDNIVAETPEVVATWVYDEGVDEWVNSNRDPKPNVVETYVGSGDNVTRVEAPLIRPGFESINNRRR